MILKKKNAISAGELSSNINQLMEHYSSEELMQFFDNMSAVNQLYSTAIREASTKLETIDKEFQLLYRYKPIHHMESRLKTPQSIMNKLDRLGLARNVSSAIEHLTDIAGIRIICKYMEDVYTIAHLLLKQDDLTLIKISDYIRTPKISGYRSLHVVILVPVYFPTVTRHVPVEIQLRTIAMDFWSSLEHELHYKTLIDLDDSLKHELRDCAEKIAAIDNKMQDIHKRIHKTAIGEIEDRMNLGLFYKG